MTEVTWDYMENEFLKIFQDENRIYAKNIYNSIGNLEKVQMIQDEKDYKNTLYFYNFRNELVLKEKEEI